MSERVRAVRSDGYGTIAQLIDTLADCHASYDASTQSYTGSSFYPYAGRVWSAGLASFSTFNTIIPPNGPSCKGDTGAGASHGWLTASSRHEGGLHVLLADGSSRYVSENIDAGDQTVTAVPTGESIYGVWGALGSRAGGEVVQLP